MIKNIHLSPPGKLYDVKRKFRTMGCLALISSLVVFSILVVWIILRFSLPKPGTVQIGTIQDFPSNQEPRMFWQNSSPFYVLNTGDHLIALAAQSVRRGQSCLVLWNPEQEQFVDSCWGTRMDMYGKYEGGGPPWEMTQLPVHVVDGKVWVEVRAPDTEWYLSTVSPGQ